MALVSIVVVAYNAEAFVAECLASISGQTYGDWEALLIDDGSEDATGHLFVELAKRDNRVKVILKENGGTSSARNSGLSACTGEWVWFVDADDWLELRALEEMEALLRETDANIVGINHFFNFDTLPQKGKERQPIAWKATPICPEVLVREGREEVKWLALGAMSPYYVEKRTGLRFGPMREGWSKLFRRSFLETHNIRFEEILSLTEDTVFCFDAFMYASKVVLYNRYLLHYRLHALSKERCFQPEMKRINELTMESFCKRMDQWGRKDEDFRPAFLGMCADRLFGMMRCYVLHEELHSVVPRKKRRAVLRETLQGRIWQSLREDKQDLRFLPRGKRELVYCIQQEWYGAACLLGRLLLWGIRQRAYLRRWEKLLLAREG
ncbi:MAG: glycosyltransferase [Tannerellaceae bacterium]|jgi:glycosyltransferase involved in cell wall biosynthesis|nr:glycosyltransferase [Tannerellaceae bacterium]